jgi:hypothetical protein
MVLFSTILKVGSDTFLYKIYENGFKAFIRVAGENVKNLPVLYVPKSIEQQILKSLESHIDELKALPEQGRSRLVNRFWMKLMSTCRPSPLFPQ